MYLKDEIWCEYFWKEMFLYNLKKEMTGIEESVGKSNIYIKILVKNKKKKLISN